MISDNDGDQHLSYRQWVHMAIKQRQHKRETKKQSTQWRLGWSGVDIEAAASAVQKAFYLCIESVVVRLTPGVDTARANVEDKSHLRSLSVSCRLNGFRVHYTQRSFDKAFRLVLHRMSVRDHANNHVSDLGPAPLMMFTGTPEQHRMDVKPNFIKSRFSAEFISEEEGGLSPATRLRETRTRKFNNSSSASSSKPNADSANDDFLSVSVNLLDTLSPNFVQLGSAWHKRAFIAPEAASADVTMDVTLSKITFVVVPATTRALVTFGARALGEHACVRLLLFIVALSLRYIL